MRIRRRLLVSGEPAVYHVMSRTAFRLPQFGDMEKEIFTRMLFQQAAFAGIDVLAYCIMSNHVHLLVWVPPVDSLPDGVLLERYGHYYGHQKTPRSTYSIEELKAILQEDGPEAEIARRRILSRMGDLSAFMRELKQRFTIWYNQRHENSGTIWAARYKSLLVEASAESLSRVAAYIDLNPVRAGLVDDPKNYRWCGYASALGGNRLMRYAVIQLFGQKCDFKEVLKSYRIILYGKGYSGKGGEARCGTISPDKLEAVLRQGGSVAPDELLRMRIRYFTDGLVLGSKEYIETVFRDQRTFFGPSRSKISSALPGEAWGGLHSMRNLQKSVYSSPKLS